MPPFFTTRKNTMNNDIADREPAGNGKTPWYESRVLSIAILVLVLAIIIGVYYFYQKYPDTIENFKDFGYLGAFLISLVLNATVVLPSGNFLVLAALGATLPSPILVGLAGGIGAAIGEMTGYMAGYSGRGIIQRQKLYARLEGWVGKWGMLTWPASPPGRCAFPSGSSSWLPGREGPYSI
jgi:membrane protein DedA with SNARE-associated domain